MNRPELKGKLTQPLASRYTTLIFTPTELDSTTLYQNIKGDYITTTRPCHSLIYLYVAEREHTLLNLHTISSLFHLTQTQ